MEVLVGALILVTTMIVSSACLSTKSFEEDYESEKVRMELIKEELIRRMK